MSERKKYDVAKTLHRASVTYAIEITEKANDVINKDFFSKNQSDFQNNTGIGLLFFMEGMSKISDQAGIWVTFVDMKSKTVIFTEYLTGQTGGVGFRNNWAASVLRVLKRVEKDPNWGNSATAEKANE